MNPTTQTRRGSDPSDDATLTRGANQGAVHQPLGFRCVEQSPNRTEQAPCRTAPTDRLLHICPVLVRAISLAARSTGIGAAVHSAAPVLHRRTLARLPGGPAVRAADRV